MCLWTPAPVGSRRGNRITSGRWARLLRDKGFRVRHTGGRVAGKGILLALHAVASRPVLLNWRGGPRVVVVTGTDLNGPQCELALDTLNQAEAVVVLQPLDRERLSPALRAKTRVILPGVSLPAGLHWKPPPQKLALAVSHLRAVKMPQTLPEALLLAPEWHGCHLGSALEEGWAERLRGWPRFEWLGERSRRQTLQWMARCSCFVLASQSEGCSNALCEALALGVPVLASDIPGNRGLLGDDFQGYFPVGDAVRLAALLREAPLAALAEWAAPWRERLSLDREASDLVSLLSQFSNF